VEARVGLYVEEENDRNRSNYRKVGWSKRYCEPSDAYTGHYDKDWEYTGGGNKLDQCNGHFAPTTENPEGIYHYHITTAYPYIPRCYTKMK
jgi:hypothetical protein